MSSYSACKLQRINLMVGDSLILLGHSIHEYINGDIFLSLCELRVYKHYIYVQSSKLSMNSTASLISFAAGLSALQLILFKAISISSMATLGTSILLTPIL